MALYLQAYGNLQVVESLGLQLSAGSIEVVMNIPTCSGPVDDPDLWTMHTTALSTSLDQMTDSSRVWVYKSAMPFTEAQCAELFRRGGTFVEEWAAHGVALSASFDLLHRHFMILTVDEQRALASGCSIDASVRFIRGVEVDLQLRLTDRMVVLYEKDGGIVHCRVPELEQLVKSGVLTGDTVVFDDLVATLGELRTHFRVPLRSTWMARYL